MKSGDREGRKQTTVQHRAKFVSTTRPHVTVFRALHVATTALSYTLSKLPFSVFPELNMPVYKVQAFKDQSYGLAREATERVIMAQTERTAGQEAHRDMEYR